LPISIKESGNLSPQFGVAGEQIAVASEDDRRYQPAVGVVAGGPAGRVGVM